MWKMLKSNDVWIFSFLKPILVAVILMFSCWESLWFMHLLGFVRCSDWYFVMKSNSSYILLFESSTGSGYELSSSLQPTYHSSRSEVFKSPSWQELDCKGLSLIRSVFFCNCLFVYLTFSVWDILGISVCPLWDVKVTRLCITRLEILVYHV